MVAPLPSNKEMVDWEQFVRSRTSCTDEDVLELMEYTNCAVSMLQKESDEVTLITKEKMTCVDPAMGDSKPLTKDANERTVKMLEGPRDLMGEQTRKGTSSIHTTPGFPWGIPWWCHAGAL